MDVDIFFYKFDENGEMVWLWVYGCVFSNGVVNEYFGEVWSMVDGGFFLCGGSDEMGYVVKMDWYGNIFFN